MTVTIDYADPKPPISSIKASCAVNPKDCLIIYQVGKRVEMKIVDSSSSGAGSPAIATVQLTLEDMQALLSALDKLIYKMETE
jgi:hypothetical protein